VVGLKGAEQGYWPGSGVHSHSKPVNTTLAETKIRLFVQRLTDHRPNFVSH
jgi:hypothetical protein